MIRKTFIGISDVECEPEIFELLSFDLPGLRLGGHRALLPPAAPAELLRKRNTTPALG